MSRFYQLLVIFLDIFGSFRQNYNYQIMKKVLFLLFLLLLSIQQQDKCLQIVTNWMQDPQNLDPIVYGNSGKLLNDLGDYNNCLFHKEQYVYFTLQVFNRLASQLQHIGLCAPLQCKAQINSNQYAPIIQQQLNKAYQDATGSKFVPFLKLNFYVPTETRPQFDWSNYLTVGLILFLVVLGVAGSIVSRLSQKESIAVKVLKAFSFYDNFNKIITIPKEVENDNLLFLNGARVISIFWIVYGHDLWFKFANLRNWTESLDIMITPGMSTVATGAFFAVDTFFWIGGFLITLGMLEQLKKSKSFIKFYIGSLVHRIIRIWPTYMIAILIFWKIAPYMGNGPIWRVFYDLSCSCNNGGVLWNIIFVDNFGDHGANGRDYCFGWGWYLAVDFQLFIITPFFLYAYSKNKKLGWIITFALFLTSVLIAFIQIYVNDWRYPIPSPKFPPQPNFMDKYYYKPWIRASAYFMGVFSGFIYLQWKDGNAKVQKYVNKVKQSVTIRTLFYIIGITLTQGTLWIIVPFQTGESQWSTLTQALYNSLNRVSFLIGVYLCVFACMFGCKNDPTRIILGHWIFSFLAKISFCIYLTHFIVILASTYSVRSNLYWQTSSAIYLMIADALWVIICGLCLSCLIEAPILSLEKIFLRPPKKGEKGSKQKPISSIAKEQNLSKPLMAQQQLASQQIPDRITPQRQNDDKNNMLL